MSDEQTIELITLLHHIDDLLTFFVHSFYIVVVLVLLVSVCLYFYNILKKFIW